MRATRIDANVTVNGRQLAKDLEPSIGKADASILQICSLIARHAATVQRYAIHECNIGSLSDGDQERANAAEARIRELVATLPLVKDEKTGEMKPIRPKFGGDPRGFTVKLVLPDGRHNTWGGKEEGWGVPGS